MSRAICRGLDLRIFQPAHMQFVHEEEMKSKICWMKNGRRAVYANLLQSIFDMEETMISTRLYRLTLARALITAI